MGPITFKSQVSMIKTLLIFYFQILTLFKDFVLSIIGITLALGQSLDISIVIRTLAGTLAFAKEKYLPFCTMPGFLDILDIPNHP